MSLEQPKGEEELEAEDRADFDARYAHMKNLTPKIREHLWKQFRISRNKQREAEALQARLNQERLKPLAERAAASREELASAVEKWKKGG